MDATTDNLMSIPQAAELYSALMGYPGIVWRTRFSRLVSAGRLGEQGKDWGRIGPGKTCTLWVTESAVRRFAAARLAKMAAAAEVES